MPVVQVHELAGRTRVGYADALRELALPGPPPGPHLHAGGPLDGGWRSVEGWESEAAAGACSGSEAFQRMAQRLGITPNVVASSPVESVRT
jgi:hypothetical protein